MMHERKLLAVLLAMACSAALPACGDSGTTLRAQAHEDDDHGHGDEAGHGEDGQDDEHDDEHEEGRTRIAPDVALALGVVAEPAGPAVMRETAALFGIVRLKPSARADVRAVYPGRVLEATATVGDTVEAGDTLAVVENASSLQAYRVPAPISGTVLERFSNPGDVANDRPLYRLADLNALQAELHVFPRDAARIEAGQSVTVRLAGGDIEADGRITAFLPLSETATQSLIARVELPEGSGFRPGMRVEARVATAEYDVPLAVRESGIQRYRNGQAVFVQEGAVYEARLLELGRRDGVFAEVLSGLEPGETYVVENSFLILADIEKAGAGHNH
ncbi:HlyD family efflux transporter periplasmic adaptor subunit [Maricaulis sp.]|uniref:efflux RND transporter periplasmic adaptor subunit n=1 Tax=Maricaulis sp. TaxID=1486257 RepID=UPI0032975551